ncbi:MAG: glycine C-acetyltransferase [Deltaproteobacteria bacterium]|nr:glycine C-acetyltransferase [Deltaproteobacteria bacterium]
MNEQAKAIFRPILDEISRSGLYKEERILTSPQGSRIRLGAGREVLNFCANNYLGLANHPQLLAAAQHALSRHGFGLSSVRFICGTQDIHRELEHRIAAYLGMEDAILYTSCFDANGGLFETLLDEECAVISDALNHASIIDGIRLCKARRFVYRHGDMNNLEDALRKAASAKIRLVATDGVFSMDGDVAKLPEIVALAERHRAMVMVDDSHATGFLGATGRGTSEYCGVAGKIDIITSTLGKALGGASGGFTCGFSEMVELLRQRSRPYLFSNSLAPVIVATSIQVLEILSTAPDLRQKLMENTHFFRARMTAAGFDIKPGVHPIVPIMLYDARLAKTMAADMLNEGIYVIGFSYPVVPREMARIRVQISAAHSHGDIEQCLAAFQKIGRKHGII